MRSFCACVLLAILFGWETLSFFGEDAVNYTFLESLRSLCTAPFP